MDAIRYENARSAEKAYESLKISDMQKMFKIENKDELINFIHANNGKVFILYIYIYICYCVGKHWVGDTRR